jgi:hypothetical protein
MEVMDALAADVSYKYIRDSEINNEATIVTVAVDNIIFDRSLSSKHDLMLSVSIRHCLFIVYSATH